MNTREFYVAVADANISEELTAFANDAIVKMDASNEKNRAKAAEKRAAKAAENEPLKAALLGAINETAQTATDLLGVTGLDISKQKVSMLLRGYVTDGIVVKEEIKLDGGKKAIGYKRA